MTDYHKVMPPRGDTVSGVHRLLVVVSLFASLLVARPARAQVVSDCSPETVLAAATGARKALLERARIFHDWAPDYQQSHCLDLETGLVAPRDGGPCDAPAWWRTDCSGFVSSAWDLGGSLDTAELASGGTSHGRAWAAKTWGDLEPGDAIVHAHDHVALFTGWLDAQHAAFCVMEEIHVAYTDPWGGLGCVADEHVTDVYETEGFTPIGLVGLDGTTDGGTDGGDAGRGDASMRPGATAALVLLPRTAAPATKERAVARGECSVAAVGSAPRKGGARGTVAIVLLVVCGAWLRRRGRPAWAAAPWLAAPMVIACSGGNDGFSQTPDAHVARDATTDAHERRDATSRSDARDAPPRADASEGRAPPDASDAPHATEATIADAKLEDALGASDGGPTTLVSGQPGPWGIAVDATSVYWTSLWDGTVRKAPVAGGPAVVIATSAPHASALVLDGDRLFWTSSTTVASVLVDGGSPILLAENEREASGLTLTPTALYWTTYRSGGLNRVARDGGWWSLVDVSDDAWGVAAGPGGIYWATGTGAVMMQPFDGGAPMTLATSVVQPVGVAVADASLYWTDYGAGSVMGTALDGGAPFPLATGQTRPSCIAVDGAFVYWTTPSTVMRAPRVGGAPVTIARGEGSPSGLAFDAARVYWTDNADGTIRAATK